MEKNGRVPDFAIIGAPKCGTSALHYYLGGHASIYMPPRELNFFCHDIGPIPGSCRTLSEYVRNLDAGREALVVGEKSPWYLCSTCAVRGLLRHNPDVKLIAILRHPVEMAWSLYRFFRYLGIEDAADFETAWRAGGSHCHRNFVSRAAKSVFGEAAPWILSYSHTCAVGTQLKRVYEAAPKDQILVVFAEQLRAQPVKVYRRVLGFLGAPYDGRTSFSPVNLGRVARWEWLNRFIVGPPPPLYQLRRALAPLARSLGLHVGSLVVRWNSRNARAAGVSPRLRRIVHRELREEIQIVEDLLGRRIPEWEALSE